MVVLEFHVDAAIIAADCGIGDLRKADRVAIYQTYFMMPVRLRIGAIEILELDLPDNLPPRHPVWRMPSPAWQELPLLHVATVGLDTIRETRQVGVSRYDVPEDGTLYLTMNGADVAVMSSNRPTMIGRAPYCELLDAFEQFADQVRETLGQECPELKEHPYWGPWFRGEEVRPV